MGRLFWKLFLSFWLAMMTAFFFGGFYMNVMGGERPSDGQSLLIVPTTSAIVIGFAFSYFMAWYLSRPLRHLRWALFSMSKGRFATRVGPLLGRRRDEIVDLGKDFDSMADRLQLLIESRQRLLHDISHELRSPLTRMQAAIGLLRQDATRGEAVIARIETESLRLNAMVEQILTLARLETEDGKVETERVDLIELLAAIADDAAFEAEACNRTVIFKAHGDFVVDVSAEVLCRAFENIIRNAVKYTAEGTTVAVTAQVMRDGAELRLMVEDHGPGVPQDMLEKIFDPFLRLDATARQPGFGLGLAIARRAIEFNGGRVWAERMGGDEGGLRMVVTIPANAEQPSRT